MFVADIIIPVLPEHRTVLRDAVRSAKAQTIPCNVIVQEDGERRGAAATRNAAVKRGTAPFLIFLDADDILLPTFAEACLRRWLETNGRGYVYTDWRRGDKIAAAMCDNNIWRVGLYHTVTTLLPRRAFERVGGFDETLPALEDEDLYRRIQRAGLCAFRVPEPLLRYRMELGHSPTNDKNENRAVIVKQMAAFFDRRDSMLSEVTMCACNENQPAVQTISGEQMPGDIMALALYTPRRRTSPTQPGRTYERPVMGEPMWVAPSDVAAKPEWWSPIALREQLAPDVDSVLRLVNVAP